MATSTIVVTYTVGTNNTQEAVTGVTVDGTDMIGGSPTAAEVNEGVRLLQTARKKILATKPTLLAATGTSNIKV
jgi:hypothetical protein